MKESEELQPSYIVNCVFNAILSCTAILLNSVTIHALRKLSSLPKPFKILLLSLAVSDLGVGLIVQPLYIAVIAIDLKQNTEYSTTFDETYIAFITSVNLFTLASFIGVMALSIDRFLAIQLHLRYQELVTHKRTAAAVIKIWIFSLFCSLVRLWIPRYISYAIFTIVASSCLVSSTLLNYKVYIAVRRHTNQIQALQLQQAAQTSEMENRARIRKFAVGTFFVYLAFMVCYMPRMCTLIVVAISGTSTTATALRVYTLTLTFLNSSLNPLIYSWQIRHIRHAVVNILRNILRKKK